MTVYHFERALFVVGEPDSGKSTQLRSMFRDVRLGTAGTIPTSRNLADVYRLSNERSLYLRITSPHEWEESLSDFLDKTEEKMRGHTPRHGRRWNFACALQPFAAKNMPDLVAVCRGFDSRFNPERIRFAFLSPDRHGNLLQSAHDPLVSLIQAVSRTEVCWIDARDRRVNGLQLADFFDLT